MSRQINNFIEAFEVKCEEKGIGIIKARNEADVSRSNYSKYTHKLYLNPSYELPRDKAIALSLSTQPKTLEEMQLLLSYAGFTLSECIPKDRIVMSAIKNRRYGWVRLSSEF